MTAIAEDTNASEEGKKGTQHPLTSKIKQVAYKAISIVLIKITSCNRDLAYKAKIQPSIEQPQI